MPITNKANGLKTESDQIQNFLTSIGNPEIEQHVNALPIPPQAKQFFNLLCFFTAYCYLDLRKEAYRNSRKFDRKIIAHCLIYSQGKVN